MVGRFLEVKKKNNLQKIPMLVIITILYHVGFEKITEMKLFYCS